MSSPFGRYVAAEPLGSGASGTVYRGVATGQGLGTGREVAIKVLGREDAAARALFLQEYRTMLRLDHPGLVRAFEHGVGDGGRTWFAMELVGGPGVPETGRWETADLVALLRPLCHTLDYLHGLGLVHGDLKPQNLRFDRQGELKLLDIGFLAPAGSPGKRRGTLEYMAPEVIRGDPLDPRSDLYALGTIAYRLLAGRAPFEGESPMALLAAQLSAEPEPLARLRPDLPADVAEIVAACLAKDPGRRPRRARDVLAAVGEPAGRETGAWSGEAAGAAPYLLFGCEMFGREAEAAQLFAAVHAQIEGKGAAIGLAGQAGQGKSRLLRAVAALARQDGYQVLEASGRGDGPFQLAADLVQNAEPLMAERGLDCGDPLWQPLRALAPWWGEAPPPLEPRNQEARLRQALALLLSVLAGGRGIVVAIDDWDLADPASRDLVAPLLSGTNDQTVAWVYARRAAEDGAVDGDQTTGAAGDRASGAAGDRPAGGPPPGPAKSAGHLAQGPDGLAELPLAPLAQGAVADLVRSALGEEPPEGLLEPLLGLTDGNAARLRAVLEHWRAAGVLSYGGPAAKGGRGWRFDGARSGELPEEIRAGAAVTFAGLTPDARRCATIAAVLGHDVALAELCDMLGGAEPFNALAELEQCGVLQRAGQGRHGGRYRFQGALREALLADLPAAEAEGLNLAAARMLEAGASGAGAGERGGEASGERRVRGAFHHLAAGAAGSAAAVLAAAQECFASGAVGSAARLLEGLADRRLPPRDEAEVRRLQGDIKRLHGDGKAALAHYERAVDLLRRLMAGTVAGSEAGTVAGSAAAPEAPEAPEAPTAASGAASQPGDPKATAIALARELVSFGRAAMMVSDNARARQLLEEGAAAARGCGERYQEARAALALGRLSYFEGLAGDAARFTEEALDLGQALGDEGLQADALAFLGVQSSPGDPFGRERLSRAAAIQRRLCNPIGLIDALINLGDRLHAAGDLERSRDVFEEAHLVARQAAAQTEEPFILLNLAQIALDQGRVSPALEAAQRGFELAERQARPFPAGYALSLASAAHLARGEYSRAREAAEGALERATRTGNRYLETAARLAQGEMALEAGDLDTAADAIDAAADLARARDDQVSLVRSVWLRGRFLTLIGERTEAAAALGDARRAAAQSAARMEELRIRLAQGYLALVAGDYQAARASAEASLEGATDMGAALLAAQANWLLGETCRRAGDESRAFFAYTAGARYAGEAGTPLLLALCELGLASLGMGTPAAEFRRKGSELLRRLRSFAGTDGFFRWPERDPDAAPSGAAGSIGASAAPALAEVLGAVKEMYEARSLGDLLERLLARVGAIVHAERGALLAFRDRQVVECAVHGMTRDEAIEAEGLDRAVWDLLPVHEERRWLVPAASGSRLSAVLVVEGGALAGRDVLPFFAEAIDLAVTQFLQWQDIQDRVERLAFAETLARSALSGAEPVEVLREGLAAALEITGAERILALRVASGGALDQRLGLDKHGALLPPGALISRSICNWVVATKEAVRLLDAQDMEGWQQQQSILALGLRTIVAVPLVQGDAVRGILYMDSENLMTTFGPREQALLEAAAEVLAPLVDRV